MNRYRFYEIIQAHKKGEDLSKFVPKNKPEADLINVLQGGGGSVDVTVSPTAIPNSGTLKEFYFNKKLTASEVEAELDKITDWVPQDMGGTTMYTQFALISDMSADSSIPPISLFVIKFIYDNKSYYTIALSIGQGMTPIYVSDMPSELRVYLEQIIPADSLFAGYGWNPELNTNCITLHNNNEVHLLSNDNGLPIGTCNELIVNVLSATDFTNEAVKLTGTYDGSAITVDKNQEVDLRTLLNEGKLPLKILIH